MVLASIAATAIRWLYGSSAWDGAIPLVEKAQTGGAREVPRGASVGL
jgi:hypothetical protein